MGWEILGSLALSAYDEIGSSSLSYDQSKVSIESINRMLKNLKQQQEELQGAYSARKGIATDIYGNKVKDATFRAREGLKSMGKQYRMGEAMTDMAFHGGLYEKAKEGEQSIKYDLTSKKRDYQTKLDETFANIGIAEAKDTATIENTMEQLKGQRGIQQEAVDDSWWSTDIGGHELKWYWDKSFLSDIF